MFLKWHRKKTKVPQYKEVGIYVKQEIKGDAVEHRKYCIRSWGDEDIIRIIN